jgi:hypothetical protein
MQSAPENSPFCEDWQLNHKLSHSLIPKWNRARDALVDYISRMSRLAILSQRMKEGIAQMAPYKWSRQARAWREVLPPTDQKFISQDWDVLLTAIQSKFMDQAWISKKQREFEEMKFRQSGHRQGLPEMFLQRCIRLHMILYEETDGASVIKRILQTQPELWGTHLGDKIQDLLMAASTLEKSLVSLYLLTRVADSQPYSSESNRDS